MRDGVLLRPSCVTSKMDPVVAAVVIGGLALLTALLWLVRSNSIHRRTRLPPVKGGWMPWVGCAIPFGKEPLLFIEQTRKEVSPALDGNCQRWY